nr:MAG TPA: hypothetical protein [Caudoviricetes sp.]
MRPSIPITSQCPEVVGVEGDPYRRPGQIGGRA